MGAEDLLTLRDQFLTHYELFDNISMIIEKQKKFTLFNFLFIYKDIINSDFVDCCCSSII